MNAPLPEVPPHKPKKRDFAKAPLPLLSVFCAIDAVIVILSPVIHTPIAGISQFWDWMIYGFVAGLGLMLTWYLWQGYSLARRVWLWLTVLTLPMIFFPDQTLSVSSAQKTVTLLNNILAVFSLIWLNLPGVKAHFSQHKTREEALQ